MSLLSSGERRDNKVDFDN